MSDEQPQPQPEDQPQPEPEPQPDPGPDTRSDAQRTLDDLKAQCLGAEETPEQHADHAAALEAAYAAFQQETMGQSPVPEAPVADTSEPPVDVPLTAEVAVASE